MSNPTIRALGAMHERFRNPRRLKAALRYTAPASSAMARDILTYPAPRSSAVALLTLALRSEVRL